MRKRILTAFVLVFLLLTQMTVYAASGALSIDPVSGKPGEQVQLKVNLQNPGIIATRILVQYDSKALRLDKAENGNIFEKNTAVFGGDTASNPYILLWDDSLRTDNITKSGTLCTLTFTVLPGASGDKTSVRFTVDKGSTFDFNLNEVSVADATAEVRLSSSGTTAKPTEPSKPADTTKAADTPKTTKAGDTTKPAKVSDSAQPAPVIGADAAMATTKAAVTTAKTADTTKAPAGTTAKAAPSDAQKTTKAPTASTASNKTAPVAENGKTTKAAAPTADAGTTAAAPDETPTVPDILSAEETTDLGPDDFPVFAEPLPHTDVEESTTEQLLIDPIPPQKNGRQLLWLLLLIPIAAVVVVVIVLKKKKNA